MKTYTRKLPILGASLLPEGVALKVLDGDGLLCPTKWIQAVLVVVQEPFELCMGIEGRDRKVFMLTILERQTTGKSTLLNRMFGVQFPVSAAKCTKGAFLQIIPLQMEGCAYDAVNLVDTEGLGALEYEYDKTHDNEIGTFVLGVSEFVLINLRGRLIVNMENFLQVITAALMRTNTVHCHSSAVFVHQSCDPNTVDCHSSAVFVHQSCDLQAKDKSYASKGIFIIFMKCCSSISFFFSNARQISWISICNGYNNGQ